MANELFRARSRTFLQKRWSVMGGLMQFPRDEEKLKYFSNGQAETDSDW